MENIEVSGKKFDSLSKVHRVLGIPAPLHPLVSLIKTHGAAKPATILTGGVNFYIVSYGTEIHHEYGSDDNTICTSSRLLFRTPNQTFAIPACHFANMGMTLIFHPLLLSGFQLAHKIKKFDFFSHEAKAGFPVTQLESDIILTIFELLNQELHGRIDDFSQDVIVSQIELLLNYCDLFYRRKQSRYIPFAEVK